LGFDGPSERDVCSPAPLPEGLDELSFEVAPVTLSEAENRDDDDESMCVFPRAKKTTSNAKTEIPATMPHFFIGLESFTPFPAEFE
jgi:hypothetical protein